MFYFFVINLQLTQKFSSLLSRNFEFRIKNPIVDCLLYFISISYLAYFFINFNYVTPSASLLYYIFYDYLKFYFDTNFYRPNLPIENPAGTWLTMLTYHPGIYSPIPLISTTSDFLNYRFSFALIVTMSHIGSFSWCAIFSGIFLKNLKIGILVFLCSFSYILFPGLIQTMYRNGSHDTPFFIIYCCINNTSCLCIQIQNK